MKGGPVDVLERIVLLIRIEANQLGVEPDN